MKAVLLSFTTVALLAAAVVLSSGQAVEQPRVSWEGNRATIAWTESLADPQAAADEVPFALLSGPYLGWVSPTEVTVGWEVIAQRSLSASPYASLPAAFPAEQMQFRSVTLSGLQP